MKPEISAIPEREIVSNDVKRLFSKRQRAEIFKRAGGNCEICGAKVLGSWVAGHVIPHWSGGMTEIDNGRVEGIDCGCAKTTQRADKTNSSKSARLRREKGRHSGKKVAKIRSGGFNTRLRKKLNGTVEVRND